MNNKFHSTLVILQVVLLALLVLDHQVFQDFLGFQGNHEVQEDQLVPEVLYLQLDLSLPAVHLNPEEITQIIGINLNQCVSS